MKKEINKSLIIITSILGLLLIVVAPFAYRVVLSEVKGPNLTKDEKIQKSIDGARELALNFDDKDKEYILYSLYGEEVKREQTRIYNEAVNATYGAVTSGMQESVNYARSLISSLSDTYSEKKIDMSLQLDAVQQVLIDKTIEAVNYAKLTGTQSDIDKARASVLSLPAEFHGFFLPTLDELQQSFKNKAMDSVILAEKSGKKADYNKAFELYLDLTRVQHNDEVKTWAESELKSRLDKMKIID
ncbi:hypothetical protein [Clostridium sp.]|uniref:hypothetical protein n=1 Tax=Clostridium sp. TaxID=1506 RepID=UPI002FCB542D